MNAPDESPYSLEEPDHKNGSKSPLFYDGFFGWSNDFKIESRRHRALGTLNGHGGKVKLACQYISVKCQESPIVDYGESVNWSSQTDFRTFSGLTIALYRSR